MSDEDQQIFHLGGDVATKIPTIDIEARCRECGDLQAVGRWCGPEDAPRPLIDAVATLARTLQDGAPAVEYYIREQSGRRWKLERVENDEFDEVVNHE